MEKSFGLNILTPEREFFRGEVESLIISSSDGEIGIMAGHLPMVTPITVGEVKIKRDGEWKSAFNSEGFIEVTNNGVVLFVQACEWPENIDVMRAEESLRRAREHLRQKQSINEYNASKIALARAMTRLRVSNHKIKL